VPNEHVIGMFGRFMPHIGMLETTSPAKPTDQIFVMNRVLLWVYAGMLSGARRLRQQRCSSSSSTPSPAGTATAAAAAAAGAGETLRTRFNKYALTKEGRLGPAREPHKDALFAQLQAAGGQLCYRWVKLQLVPAALQQHRAACAACRASYRCCRCI
jgi:hypothetical protein